jgi:hypothetical protein
MGGNVILAVQVRFCPKGHHGIAGFIVTLRFSRPLLGSLYCNRHDCVSNLAATSAMLGAAIKATRLQDARQRRGCPPQPSAAEMAPTPANTLGAAIGRPARGASRNDPLVLAVAFAFSLPLPLPSPLRLKANLGASWRSSFFKTVALEPAGAAQHPRTARDHAHDQSSARAWLSAIRASGTRPRRKRAAVARRRCRGRSGEVAAGHHQKGRRRLRSRCRRRPRRCAHEPAPREAGGEPAHRRTESHPLTVPPTRTPRRNRRAASAADMQLDHASTPAVRIYGPIRKRLALV